MILGRILDAFSEHWRSGVEVFLLAVVIYHAYLYFRGTRGAKVLTGLLVLFLSVIFFSQLLLLVVITWIIKSLTAFFAIALVVIFQPELRRALAALGSHRFFTTITVNREILDELTETVFDLSNRQLGALIAVERDINLRQYAESGVSLDAEITRELIVTIFHSRTPLHDGGLVIRNDRVVAAACIFPVSAREDIERNLGLRHRAALGLCDDTDAVAIVVSEETGIVSVCHRGKLERNLTPDQLRKRLAEALSAHDPTNDKKPVNEQLGREAGIAGGRADNLGGHQKDRRNEQHPPPESQH